MAIHAALALPKGKVQALVVVDVVEGTALAALPNTMKIVQSRPQKFADVKSAIFWAYHSILNSKMGWVGNLEGQLGSPIILCETQSRPLSPFRLS
jgi:protein phosphatase methylesterase 1